MKSAKQNTIRQSIEQHRITLIESKRFTTTDYFNRVKTTIHYYSLVLNRERAMRTMAIKRIDLERHRLLIKLDPASK